MVKKLWKYAQESLKRNQESNAHKDTWKSIDETILFYRSTMTMVIHVLISIIFYATGRASSVTSSHLLSDEKL